MTRLFSLLLLMVSLVSVKAGPSVTFQWDPSPEDCIFLGKSNAPSSINANWCVNNYRLYWGPSSGNYTNFTDCGHVTNYVFTSLERGGRYFFVVTAMVQEGAESDPSNELDFLVPAGNTPPWLTSPGDVSLVEGMLASAPLPFKVNDAETPTNLVVTANSSNPSVLLATGVELGGSGTNRTVVLKPVFGAIGWSDVTLTVSDGQGGFASVVFRCTVSSGRKFPGPGRLRMILR